ncbi:MAG: hypothetical protein U9R17_07160 [Thermodesulfobacteriota bacterium]|nr:hypothetical protein [Thermodesulfobacteriota bacterium]
MNGVFRWDIARLFGEMGLLQIFFPPSYGGLEEDKTLMFCLWTMQVKEKPLGSPLFQGNP